MHPHSRPVSQANKPSSVVSRQQPTRRLAHTHAHTHKHTHTRAHSQGKGKREEGREEGRGEGGGKEGGNVRTRRGSDKDNKKLVFGFRLFDLRIGRQDLGYRQSVPR